MSSLLKSNFDRPPFKWNQALYPHKVTRVTDTTRITETENETETRQSICTLPFSTWLSPAVSAAVWQPLCFN